MSDIMTCQEKLIQKAEHIGYLTFDDIMNMADTFSLSVSEVDKLSESIQLRGIIVYEDTPVSQVSEEPIEDYSRVDYEAIFTEIVTLSPELEFIVNLVKNLPPPQYGEVQSLTIQAANENAFAQKRLILIHLRLALKIALSTSKQYKFDLVDAVSSAFIGLMVGVTKFDPNGFSTFQGYTSTWIYQTITRFCNPIWMEYYYPSHYKEKLFTVLDAYEQYYGEIPNDSIHDDFLLCASQQLDMTELQIKEYLTAILGQMYNKIPYETLGCDTDELIIDNDYLDEISTVDVLYDNEAEYGEDPFEYACKQDCKDKIHRLLKSLTQREQDVLQLRFGIMDGREWTLEEIGVEFGVTRERIRQIEIKAIRKLRHPSKAKLIKDFYA